MGLFSYLFASDNTRNVKKLKVIADKVIALDEKYASYTDEELRNSTNVLKERLNNGETLNDILPDAFATVREASFRVLRMKHYYVQILGGIAIHQGRIAELKTGEGKTLMETLPAYLNALNGKGVHIVTVNEYLAKRDADWMGKIFTFLGLTVGITLSNMRPEQKKQAYNCDITYGTNSEFGFDYLRDNMCVSLNQKVQRGHQFAIVDEVDSILIDEARTPLIISGGKGFRSTENYTMAQSFVKTLNKEKDVENDEEKKQIRLTDSGVTKAERFYRIDNLSDAENLETNHFINNALRANFMMQLDKDYIVDDKDEVLIVDEFTGRVMAGRRFSDGLHQAIEAKEGVKINDENLTVATITYQNYFRLYKKLSGMTGTAKTEEIEFNKIYKLDVVQIPTNKPIQRIDRPDIFFKTHHDKLVGIVREIKERSSNGQPILIGTTTVEKSEELSDLLKKEKIKHVVLNAKNHQKEGEIVAQAGKVGAVTIATNMAGRGTDILLGGNPEFLAKQQMKQEAFEDYYINEATSFAPTDDEKVKEAKKRYQELYEKFKAETDKEKEQVIALGGLYIIGTERHESRRIDNQLRGRAGRQGDVGESVFCIALDDDIARIFGGDWFKNMMNIFKTEEGEPLMQSKMISKRLEAAQKKIEGNNFSIRRTILQYDDVMNAQRTIIYGERDKVLEGKDFHEEIMQMIREYVESIVRSAISDDKVYYEWNLQDLNNTLESTIFPKGLNFITEENVEEKEVSDIVDMVYEEVAINVENKREATNKDAEQVGIKDVFSNLERQILLRYVDMAWMEHIDSMDILRREIGTRQDPVNEYKKIGYDMFEEMTQRIRENTAKFIINVKIERTLENLTNNSKQTQNLTTNVSSNATLKNDKKEPNRNDPCPCGSGKKYKNCCGK